jgi:hypothetical protein
VREGLTQAIPRPPAPPQVGYRREEDIEKGRCRSGFFNTGSVSERVTEAIRLTGPQQFGERNDRIFEYARYLRAISEFTQLTDDEIMALASAWFQRARYRVRTQDFQTTLKDLRVALPRVEHPIGESIQSIFKRTTGKGIERLEDLCRLLQEIAGDEPFHLDCRTVGKLFEKSHVTAAKWFKRLIDDSVLAVVEEHKYQAGQKGQARKFRYQAQRP